MAAKKQELEIPPQNSWNLRFFSCSSYRWIQSSAVTFLLFELIFRSNICERKFVSEVNLALSLRCCWKIIILQSCWRRLRDSTAHTAAFKDSKHVYYYKSLGCLPNCRNSPNIRESDSSCIQVNPSNYFFSDNRVKKLLRSLNRWSHTKRVQTQVQVCSRVLRNDFFAAIFSTI